MAIPTVYPEGVDFASAYMADVSTASSAMWTVPTRCELIAIVGVLNAAITGADSALTATVSGTAITGATATVANASSAKGDTYTMTPTVKTYMNAGQYLDILSDGASSTTAPMFFTIIYKRF